MAFNEGRLLCGLVNSIQPKVVKVDNVECGTPKQRISNLDSFFKGCLALGLTQDDLFLASDLDNHEISEECNGHPVVNSILKLQALWSLKQNAYQEEELTLKTPPPLAASLPLRTASAIKRPTPTGLINATKIEKLIKSVTGSLQGKMSVSPLTQGNSADCLTPLIETVINSLSQEYECRLTKKESELRGYPLQHPVQSLHHYFWQG